MDRRGRRRCSLGLFVCGAIGGLIGIQLTPDVRGWFGVLAGAAAFTCLMLWLGVPFRDSR